MENLSNLNVPKISFANSITNYKFPPKFSNPHKKTSKKICHKKNNHYLCNRKAQVAEW